MEHRREFGTECEGLGAELCRRRGWQVFKRNARLFGVEVDILAMESARSGVVVEVRGRRSRELRPIHMLTRQKRRRLAYVALRLCETTKLSWRVEFLEIIRAESNRVEHRWYCLED